MSNLILGCDISNNNGNIDLKSIKNAGCKCVYMKATEGQSFKDKTMRGYYNTCKELGMKVGAYHFLVGTSAPEEQAKNFYEMIKGYDWDMIPMLDVEVNFSNLHGYVVRFITKFRELSSLELGIYSYSSFLPSLKLIQNVLENMKFWEANYNGKPFALAETFFKNRVGHQYTEKGTLGSFKGDVNYFTEDIFLSPAAKGKWKLDKTGWWYEYEDGGYPKQQWLKIDKDWYYFDNRGYMVHGWLYTTGDKSWYYLGNENSGKATKGWLLQNGKWYYFNEDCKMMIGWVKIDNKWYYMDNDGVMQTGWIKYKNNDYLLYSNGAMACNTTLYGYQFNAEGIAKKL